MIVCVQLGLLYISVFIAPGFDFCFFSTSREIGWEEHL